MTEMRWAGVMPAITTPFDADGAVDHAFLERHCRRLVDAGCSGIVALGSLGEGATLEPEEKEAVLRTCVGAVGDRVPVLPGVAALGTAQAVRLARKAEEVGCRGLMVLPPYVHKGPWREIRSHVEAILDATSLPCMVYNNPPAYGVDLLPSQLHELAREHPNMAAVKESCGDSRRITALRALAGDRLALFVGLDDMVLEGVAAGAVGWVAGLVNALPDESVRLFELARSGERAAARSLYEWFLPLLRLDTVPEFVQLIKLVQQEVGMGSERVRPPRLSLQGPEREAALTTIRGALESRPEVAS